MFFLHPINQDSYIRAKQKRKEEKIKEGGEKNPPSTKIDTWCSKGPTNDGAIGVVGKEDCIPLLQLHLDEVGQVIVGVEQEGI